MTKRKLLLLLVACIAIGALVVTATKNREPTYNGRTLSEWLDLGRSDINPAQRTHAVQQIGTNALPFLLAWIQDQPSPFELTLSDWLWRLHITYRRAERPRSAFFGFAALQEQAKPAIPALALLVDSTNRTEFWAIQALGVIGKDALPILVDVVTNSLAHTNADRRDVGKAFRHLGTNAFPAKSSLLAHIRDPDVQVATASIFALGKLGAIQSTKGLPPESTADIVPALCTNLAATNTDILFETIDALAELRSNARPAVPLLLQKLTYPDSAIRAWTTNALNQIDPQALQRAQKQ